MTCDVTYDVLGNERHKAVCELRKLPDGYPSYSAFPFAKWYEDLSTALGICKGEVSCAKVRDTLIHLLGGDQAPVTLGDPYGISKEETMVWTPEDVTRLVVVALMLLPMDIWLIALAIYWLRE